MADDVNFAATHAATVVTHDDRFQAACQRYCHAGGSSRAIAAAALRVIAEQIPNGRALLLAIGDEGAAG